MQTIWLIIQESDVKACIENLLLGSIVATSDRILVDKRNDIGCKTTRLTLPLLNVSCQIPWDLLIFQLNSDDDKHNAVAHKIPSLVQHFSKL